MTFSKDLQHLIDTFNPPPPKWIPEPVPQFHLEKHPEKEEDRYWEEQNRRWIEGHINSRGEFINPMQYFYMQECWLNDTDGNIFRPRFRDTDELMATWSLETQEAGGSLLVYKKRDAGCTSFFGNLSFYFMRIYPGCKIGITGKDQKNIANMFNDKILFSYNRFNKKVLNTEPVQMNNTTQRNSLTVSLKVFDELQNSIDTRTSTLTSSETSEKPASPTNLSGNRLKYVYVDEAALHKRIDDFLGSIFPALNKGPIRTGFLVMAGTIEPNLTSEEVSKFADLIERVKNLNVRTEMVPVWMSMFEKNGYSNKEAGLLWYHENVDKFEKAGDMKGLRDFKMQYPKDRDDIFNLSQGGIFEPDVVDILTHQRDWLKTQPLREFPYKLIPSKDTVVATPDTTYRIPDKDGGIWIIEHPKPGVIYYMDIDGIGTGTKEGAAEGSWIGCIIFKGFDKDGGDFMPCGFYYERPYTIEQGYRNMTNLWNYFNMYGGGKEINYETAQGTSDHFGTYLSKNNLYQYAYKRRDLSGKQNINQNKRGTAVNWHTRDWQIRQANEFLRKYASNFLSPIILHNLLLPQTKNADLRDAFFVFMVSIPDFDKPAVKKIVAKTRTRPILEFINGTYVYRMVEEKVQPKYYVDKEANDVEDYKEHLKERYGKRWYVNSDQEQREQYRKLKQNQPDEPPH